MNEGGAEIRFVTGLLAWLETNLPTLPEGSAARTLLETVADGLAAHYRLPRLGAPPVYTLDDATREMLARLRDVNGKQLQPLAPEQQGPFMAGMPFTYDELSDASARSAHEWLPRGNGRPKIVIAQFMHFCGAYKGALMAPWRRNV